MLQDHPAVMDDPEPLVLVESLGAATVNLRIYFWVDIARYLRARDHLGQHGHEVAVELDRYVLPVLREVVEPVGVRVVEVRSPLDGLRDRFRLLEADPAD